MVATTRPHWGSLTPTAWAKPPIVATIARSAAAPLQAPVATHYHLALASTTSATQQRQCHMGGSLGCLWGHPAPTAWGRPLIVGTRAWGATHTPCSPRVATHCHLAKAQATHGSGCMHHHQGGSLAPRHSCAPLASMCTAHACVLTKSATLPPQCPRLFLLK